MTTSTAAVPARESLVVSDAHVAVEHAQVFVAAGVMDDERRDELAVHITFEGTDDKGEPADVTVRLDRPLTGTLASALLTMHEKTRAGER